MPIVETIRKANATVAPAPAEIIMEPNQEVEEESEDQTMAPAPTQPTQSTRATKTDPTDTKFKQQKLPCCRPVIDPKHMFGLFILVGAAFAGLGAYLFLKAGGVSERKIDYTQCTNKLPGTDSGKTCANVIGGHIDPLRQAARPDCECRLTFEIGSAFKGNVYMYYELTNFYQNHRRYVRDVNDVQLSGEITKQKKPDENCRKPYRFLMSGSSESTTDLYWPCGRIANSMFRDVIQMMYLGQSGTDPPVTVPLTKSGIAWKSDKAKRFRNPRSTWNTATRDAFSSSDGYKLTKPPSWKQSRWDQDNEGVTDEDLIVWMRVAALPNFRKLYRILKRNGPFTNGLPKGKYLLIIGYSFPVHTFKGTKSIVLTTEKTFGGQSLLLAYAYMGLGGICLFFGVIFFMLFLYERQYFQSQRAPSRP